MIEEQTKKARRFHNHSLMALATSTQGEPTKKSIETEDLGNLHPIAISDGRRFVFELPFSTQINAIVNALTNKFSSSLLHTHHDNKSALLVLEGLRIQGFRPLLGRVLDYLVFCCSRGMRHGLLEESYNVVVITVKREVVDERCLISVSNPYPKQYRAQLATQILEPIQEALKALLKQTDSPQEHAPSSRSISLSRQSPTGLEIHVTKKIYHIFLHEQHSELDCYKLLLRHSLQLIREERQRYLEKLSATLNKTHPPNPSGLIEIFVVESENLLASLHSSYKEENHQGSYLHSILASETQQEIAFYKIEQLLCLEELRLVREIYWKCSEAQCQAYNANVAAVNADFSDLEVFEHLELREKYRLPAEKHPYRASIAALRSIQWAISFREMLLAIQQCFSGVKTDCLAAHTGREELNSMDDLLPVMIFVTVRAAVRNFPALLTIVDDYVRFKNVFELEERVITTLQVAIEDVSRTWTKKQKHRINTEN